MSKPIKYGETESGEFKADYAKLTPEKQEGVDRVRDMVQTAMDEVNDGFDQQRKWEDGLRAWALALFGVQLTISQIEQLRDSARKVPQNQVFMYKVTGVDNNNGDPIGKEVSTYLMVNSFNNLVRVDLYINGLEKAIITIEEAKNRFTNCGFWGLIGLAFKQLFTRSK